MSGLRNEKNQIKAAFFQLKEKLQSAIEEEDMIDVDVREEIKKLECLFHEYQAVSQQFCEQLKIYDEVDRLVNLFAEQERVTTSFTEIKDAVEQYLHRSRGGSSQHLSTKDTVVKQQFGDINVLNTVPAESAKDNLNELVQKLERTLLEAKEHQRSIHSEYDPRRDGGRFEALVRQFWAIEDVPTHKVLKPEEKLAEKLTDTSLKTVDNRYQVGIPWKHGRPKMNCNYSSALTRLEHTERRLRKDEQLAEAYKEVINSYLKKGYITRIQPNEIVPPSVWLLPHFPVIKMDKSTTKVQIVFDASARHCGVSLNDMQLQGPKLQRDVVEVLVRFRRFPIAVACDIAEMYLQVLLDPADRPYHRFLWRNLDTTQTPWCLEFSRLVFGGNSSPFLAQFVARKNAVKHQSELPLAADTVLSSTYMDDSLDSVVNEKLARQLYDELVKLWSLAGMRARKWLSNSETLLQHIPVSERATNVNLKAEELTTTKTLGVTWEAKQDCFTFVVACPCDDFQITKRSFLSKMATIFDPLGLLAPFLIRAKMLLQTMWETGLDWDHELPDAILGEAKHWFAELPLLEKIKVPRALQIKETVEESQLHMFTDSSQEAYGSVVYVRHRYSDGSVGVRLVMAKARVAPLKSISIPRLELMGAIVGLRLAETVGPILKIEPQMWYFWSDSMDILFWIRGRSRNYKPFVANRVGEIQQVTEPSQWQHVESGQNPADKLTRGLCATDLQDDSLWWDGPEYLRWPEADWPIKDILAKKTDDVEMKKSAAVTLTARAKSELNTLKLTGMELGGLRLAPERYSCWNRYLRVFAYVVRFAHNCRVQRTMRQSGQLIPEEINNVRCAIWKHAQSTEFKQEISSIKSGRQFHASSKLLPLQPWLDGDGVLRANTRLGLSDYVSWEAKYPVLLPRRHPVTALVARDAHVRAGHGGTNHTLSILTEQYWIPAARETVRVCGKQCMKCILRNARPAQQVMAPLPKMRTEMTLRAFEIVSLDYAGPFFTKQGRGKAKAKRYLCIFTCVSVRAVHLELTYSMDTDAFLNALTRMTARRGIPRQIYSDNGSNLVGADNELRKLVLELDTDKIQAQTVHNGIKWSFQPPAAPHFSGVHEIMVKAAKRAIYTILNSADVTDEELHSAFVGAEGLINSRPLTYQSADHRDLQPLTPNHFLFGQAGTCFAPDSVDVTDFNLKQRWRRVQELLRHFWGRWLREWIPSLSPRSKWNRKKTDMSVGDVVLVLSPDLPRGRWPLGRIEATFPGPDGHVRTADVRVGNAILRRPIVKLCLLDEQAIE